MHLHSLWIATVLACGQISQNLGKIEPYEIFSEFHEIGTNELTNALEFISEVNLNTFCCH